MDPVLLERLAHGFTLALVTVGFVQACAWAVAPYLAAFLAACASSRNADLVGPC